MGIRFGKKGIRTLSVLVAVLVLVAFTAGEAMALSTKVQSGYCLAPYKLKNYKLVKNPKWHFVKKAAYKRWNGTTYASCKGSKVIFQRWLRVDYDNPQSIAVTPDGKYMFIMNTPKGQKCKEYNRKGYIWRIDLEDMQKDPFVQKILKQDGYLYVDTSGARKPDPSEGEWFKGGKRFYELSEAEADHDCKAGKEALEAYLEEHPEEKGYFEEYDDGFDYYGPASERFKQGWNDYLDSTDPGKLYNHYPEEAGFAKWARENGFEYQADPENDWDYVYRNYFHHSAKILTGHGQTMAYNPKTKKLWYLPNMKQKQCKAVMVDPMTLKQEAIIEYKMKSSVKCPSTLTFDKRGNAFLHARTKSKKKNVPANVGKIYIGKLTPKKVSFNLVMQGLRWTAGTTPQSLGYNPKSDRLYLVSDRSLVTVPVKKILNASHPTLKPADIKAARWKFSREFEGIAFDGSGNGYFLTNKPDEVMLVKKDF